MIRFNFTYRDTEDYKTWVSFYPSRNKGTGFSLTFENNGYFDPRPQINTNVSTLVAIVLPFISLWLFPVSLFLCFYSWGSLYIHLPYDTGRNNTAESKTYGLMFYHPDSGFPNEFWVRGFPKLSFYFPWAYRFLKREVLMKDGWKKEEKGDDLWDKEKWKDLIDVSEHPYKYVLRSGEEQNVVATIYEKKMYWRRWFGLDVKCHHSIEVEFSGEVGEGSGSWKGGCIGCSYEILPGETAEECLRRMERERKFTR